MNKLRIYTKGEYNKFAFIVGKKVKMITVWQKEFVKDVVFYKAVPATIIDLSCFKVLPSLKSVYAEHLLVIGYGKRKLLKKPQSNLDAKHLFFYHCNQNYTKEQLFKLLEESSLLDTISISKGKGFCGVMKRWNFKGGNASHGTSLVHRSGGSYGQDHPAKMLAGTKMPGKMGGDKTTIRNLHKLSFDENKLILKGSVPGPNKGNVLIRIKIHD